MKSLYYFFSIFFFVTFSTLINAQAWVQIGQALNGEDDGGKSGYSISLSSDGLIVAVGAPWNDGDGQHLGDVRVYQNNNGVWTQTGGNIMGEKDNANLGYSVSLSSDGSVVAIGAPHYYTDGIGTTGHVKIYQNINDEWVKLGNTINGTLNSEFGLAVSLSPDSLVVAIGAPAYNNDRGIVEIFKYNINDSTWTKTGNGIIGEGAWDQCGTSVSLNSDGSVVAIGAKYNERDGNRLGHARIYTFKNEEWTQLGSDLDGENPESEFGSSISLSSDGSVVAVGAPQPYDTIKGQVKVYKFNDDSTWSQLGNDFYGTESYESLGRSVSLSSDGTVIAIGCTGANSGNGGVKIYQYKDENWIQIGNNISGVEYDVMFGYSVSLSSDGLIVAGGSPNYYPGVLYGQVSVFTFSEDATSIQDLQPNSISIYPNPTNDIIYIAFNDLNILNIKVLSSSGKILVEKTGIQENAIIDFSDYADGIYIISIQTDKKIFTKKVVKR